MKNKKQVTYVTRFVQSDVFWVLLLSVFFAVGLFGIANESTRPMLLPLSSGHLFLTFLVLVFSRKKQRKPFVLFTFLIFILGILVEAIGTKTGLLFGNYYYGDTLGLQIFGVPIIIGVNWATMVISSSAIVFSFKVSPLVKVFLAALIMTALDFLIEPVAVKLNFWQWQGGEIPFYNYFCWFVISLPMHYFYIKWKLAENNSVHKSVFVWMVVFFLVLNFV